MKPIHHIQNMPPEAIELFEAAGFIDAQIILQESISNITNELIKANNVLNIIEANPTHEMVTEWLEPIKAKYEITNIDEDIRVEPRMLIEPKDLVNSPQCLPISDQFLKNNNIEVSELPSGNLRFLDKEQCLTYLSNVKNEAKDNDILLDGALNELLEKGLEEIPLLFEKPGLTKRKQQGLDMSRVISVETFKNEGSRVTPIAKNEDFNLSKTVDKDTNQGVSPSSRFYIKGVLHRNVFKFKFSCHIFILINVLVFLAFALTSLVLIDKDKYGWAIWAPLLGVLGVFLYIIVAQGSKCPICNQKQFAPKICRKHKDAHQWPIFGYMLPTALHALIFKWFRCIYCGTSVRLKK